VVNNAPKAKKVANNASKAKTIATKNEMYAKDRSQTKLGVELMTAKLRGGNDDKIVIIEEAGIHRVLTEILRW